jgi:hypothetical protein
MQPEEAVHAIVTGDHPEGDASDPRFDVAVIDLLRAGQLEAHRAQDGALCLSLTDEGRNALDVLSFIEDPGGEL